jgi:hypothetical protein
MSAIKSSARRVSTPKTLTHGVDYPKLTLKSQPLAETALLARALGDHPVVGWRFRSRDRLTLNPT